MKSRLSAILCTCLLLTFLSLGGASVFAAMAKTKHYIDKARGFELDYPKLWTTSDKLEEDVVYTLFPGGTLKDPSVVIAVHREEGKTPDLDSLQQGLVKDLHEKIGDGKVVETKDTELGGEAACRCQIVGHVDAQNSDKKVEIKAIVTYCVHDGAVFSVCIVGTPEKTKMFEGDFDAVASTVHFMKPEKK